VVEQWNTEDNDKESHSYHLQLLAWCYGSQTEASFDPLTALPCASCSHIWHLGRPQARTERHPFWLIGEGEDGVMDWMD
jgi:hypothetical protein